MRKRIISGCLTILAFFGFVLVTSASTCEYSEQVELSRIAASIEANYEIKEITVDENGNIVDPTPEELDANPEGYMAYQELRVYALNITDKVYLEIRGDDGYNQTIHYRDTNNGVMEFDGGDFSKVIHYTITVLSDSNNCPGDKLRTISVTTPMRNTFANQGGCVYIPSYQYCQEYITAPFLASNEEILNRINTESENYRNSIQQQKYERDKTFWEKTTDFLKKNATIIITVVVVLVAIGALVAIVIIRKQRSRLI